MHEDHVINRASWEQLAAVHGQDAYYDSEGLVAGRSSLIQEEEAALQLAVGGDVAGRVVLHVQCHLGCDAITFARRGANVTGVDFSTVALSKARALAERCGVEVEWVCADVTDLPDTLDGRFDLAWATIGVLCWISDVRAWMRSVARTLKSSGSLVLIDGHPGDERDRGGSLGTSARTIHERGADYATPLKTGPQVQFTHCLAGVVSAASAAGLHVTELLEHRSASDGLCNDRWKQESNRWNQESDGQFRRRVDGEVQPLLFTLVARR